MGTLSYSPAPKSPLNTSLAAHSWMKRALLDRRQHGKPSQAATDPHNSCHAAGPRSRPAQPPSVRGGRRWKRPSEGAGRGVRGARGQIGAVRQGRGRATVGGARGATGWGGSDPGRSTWMSRAGCSYGVVEGSTTPYCSVTAPHCGSFMRPHSRARPCGVRSAAKVRTCTPPSRSHPSPIRAHPPPQRRSVSRACFS